MATHLLICLFALLSVSNAFPAPQFGNTDPGQIFVPVQGLEPLAPAKEFFLQNHAGNYHYGFSHPGQVKSEYRDSDGNVYGYYSYMRHTGDPTIVLYRAGPLGFEVSSNALPVAQTPESARATLPRDTPVVAAAKEKFRRTYEKAYIKALRGNFPHLVQ